MAHGKNVTAEIFYGDLRVKLTAENASWNPDVVDDLTTRAANLWRQSLESMLETNAWQAIDIDEYEDD